MPLAMQGGTTFHFDTGGIEGALAGRGRRRAARTAPRRDRDLPELGYAVEATTAAPRATHVAVAKVRWGPARITGPRCRE
ncbi:MAG: hypothetical protein WB810_08945 [Candidatus Cybelea sp.]